MHILCINRHYRPDTTPYATILHAMLQRFVADGHEVTAFAAQPSCHDVRHPPQPGVEVVDGVTVHRIRLLPECTSQHARRAINLIWFLMRAILFSRQSGNYDLVIGSSFPPVWMGFTLRVIQRLTGLPYIYHCQELHPESTKLSGKLQSPFVLQMLHRAEIRTRQLAERIIVLSEDMQQTVCQSQVPRERVRIINNFALHTPYDPEVQAVPFVRATATPAASSESACGTPSPLPAFRLMYAGNLGSFQALHRIVDAAHELYDEQEIQFVFMGQGEQRAALQAQAGGLLGRTVHFIDHQPTNVAFACMLQADLGIISLADDVHQTAFPSKLMTYLSAGLPLLAVVEPDSALAELVQTHSLGFVTPDATPARIAATIRQARNWSRAGLRNSPEQLRMRGEKLFGRASTLDIWSQLMAELEATCESHGDRQRTAA